MPIHTLVPNISLIEAFASASRNAGTADQTGIDLTLYEGELDALNHLLELTVPAMPFVLKPGRTLLVVGFLIGAQLVLVGLLRIWALRAFVLPGNALAAGGHSLMSPR